MLVTAAAKAQRMMMLLLLAAPALLLLLLLPSQANAQPSQMLFDQAYQKSCGASNIPALVTIMNEQKAGINVFWMDPKTRQLKQINDQPHPYKSKQPYNSHVDQTLEIHEAPDPNTGECGGETQTCRRAIIEVKESGDKNNVYMINKNFEVERETDELLIKAALGEDIPSNFELHNQSPSTFEVYWVNNNDAGSLMLLATVEPGSAFPFNSYVGNEFECHEVGSCADTNSCRMVNFKNPGNDLNVVITNNFSAMAGDSNITI